MNSLFNKGGFIDRRSFFKMSGLMGIGLAATGIFPEIAGAVKFNRDLYKIAGTRFAMGTSVSMTLLHSSRDKAEKAMELAFDEIIRLSSLMNRFDERTSIAYLNSNGMLNDILPEIWDVISSSIRYYRLTNGAFDISVKPIIDLFLEKLTEEHKPFPSEAELEEAISKVGLEKVEISGTRIIFKKPGMGITLDGIAKGYILDKVSKFLLSHNIENHLINAGGDIRVKGTRLDGKPWTIAIQDPTKKQQHKDIIHLTDAAVATSGNYEVYYDHEKMFHHIVNPKNGLSSYTNSSVSVIAPSATEADALSTSVFVMDPADGRKLIDSLPGCESLIISRTNRKIRSRGWKSATI
ncbi:MAG: FAD:protein FMN transferase [Deltaproteobacteria bacterium]|nr:FAD:protein FMN transferase [Deltaproteobacteria bacterium]